MAYSHRVGKVPIVDRVNETLYYPIIHLTPLRYMILLYTSSDANFRLNTHETKHNTGQDILAATQFWIGCMYNKQISRLWDWIGRFSCHPTVGCRPDYLKQRCKGKRGRTC
jgi:hypothetical protein